MTRTNRFILTPDSSADEGAAGGIAGLGSGNLGVDSGGSVAGLVPEIDDDQFIFPDRENSRIFKIELSVTWLYPGDVGHPDSHSNITLVNRNESADPIILFDGYTGEDSLFRLSAGGWSLSLEYAMDAPDDHSGFPDEDPEFAGGLRTFWNQSSGLEGGDFEEEPLTGTVTSGNVGCENSTMLSDSALHFQGFPSPYIETENFLGWEFGIQQPSGTERLKENEEGETFESDACESSYTFSCLIQFYGGSGTIEANEDVLEDEFTGDPQTVQNYLISVTEF